MKLRPNRPAYERLSDRQAEDAAVQQFLSGFENAYYSKLGPLYPCDFAIISDGGEVQRWIEVKSRTCRSDFYPTLDISLAKILKLKELHDATRLPTHLLIQYTDRIVAFSDFSSIHNYQIKIAGRKDRGDPMDVEPMLSIPVTAFAPLRCGVIV